MRTRDILKSVVAVAALSLTSTSFADSFKVDTSKSTLNWHGEKVMKADKHDGQIKVKSGKVEFKGGEPVSAIIVVDMKSITNNDVKDPKWNAKLVGHLKSDDFFAVEKHPEAKIVAKKFTKVKKGEYKVTGDLTIKGITKPVTFVGNVVEKDGKPAGITANLEFDRAKYDVRYGSGSFFKGLGDKLISDTVKIKADFSI